MDIQRELRQGLKTNLRAHVNATGGLNFKMPASEVMQSALGPDD
jgi:hypothetical protein